VEWIYLQVILKIKKCVRSVIGKLIKKKRGLDIMGLSKKLKDLSMEYLSDPKGQYYRHLRKILELSKASGVSRQEVKKVVDEWVKDG
jgi:hypothetical protein